MVNFGFNSASLLGILLALAGGGLYLMRSLRPEVSRDHDIFFAAVGLLCGGILLWHGWRLDPILQFSQLLLAGSAIFFAIESVRLRGVTTDQGRGRSSAYVDSDRAAPFHDRPVSRVYRAELDEVRGYEEDYEEEEVPRRRLQGTPNKSSSRRTSYEEESPRPRRTRPNQEPNASRSRNNSSPSRRSRYEDEPRNTPDHWEDDSSLSRSSAKRSTRPSDTSSSRRIPKRRPKSAGDIVSNVGTEYVDYEPLDNDEYDNPQNPKNPDNFDY
ncbi:MAG: hypothetical protein GW795_12415 [Cyanobacteria bacterium]|nr:hypothetical protein [Cyanobacteria bacterium CG_2015-16_32_12]NCO78113.1 hypothetical protein [Cyanobacteria bacterium CG_2015-22_32_23]NCQ03158.1 hypothetical protein [Cyanobacteria bacterium CG_2015-09_32_10]NCQ42647.1 hypothetical protein [Cyanobacteria bacterium CG_2015-04_32_10]NCS84025.1 hypothetical protein [Cyanobacteria bacterium CG_2015-02_32_10]